jgi:hypothetical protein
VGNQTNGAQRQESELCPLSAAVLTGKEYVLWWAAEQWARRDLAALYQKLGGAPDLLAKAKRDVAARFATHDEHQAKHLENGVARSLLVWEGNLLEQGLTVLINDCARQLANPLSAVADGFPNEQSLRIYVAEKWNPRGEGDVQPEIDELLNVVNGDPRHVRSTDSWGARLVDGTEWQRESLRERIHRSQTWSDSKWADYVAKLPRIPPR